jgi:hypothetical protein
MDFGVAKVGRHHGLGSRIMPRQTHVALGNTSSSTPVFVSKRTTTLCNPLYSATDAKRALDFPTVMRLSQHDEPDDHVRRE